METVSWPYFDPEFDTLPERIYGPILSVNIDNESLDDCTVIKVDTANRQDLLLEVVQVLTELNLSITKGYISSDAGWFMDVFHVKDENGHKLANSHSINHVQQEYFIRQVDGCPLNTDGEKDRVIKCLEAAIERRVSEGVKLELSAKNRVGLLSDITRVLRENSLAVVRADVATEGEKAVNLFYLRDMSGKNNVDMEFVEPVKKEMGTPIHLQVKNETVSTPRSSPERCHFSIKDKLKFHIERFSHTLLH